MTPANWDVRCHRNCARRRRLDKNIGDSSKGLTLEGSKTEQFAGINLKTEFSNGAQVMLGGAFGLTPDSRDAVFRASVGWEFE